MAKTSSVQKDKNRRKLVAREAQKRAKLKAILQDKDVAGEDRFSAQLRLAALPRNGSRTRIRNRCELTGRSRSFYRKFKLSRIALRELAWSSRAGKGGLK
jgi:small subunit ribosomal protein S14